MYYKDATTGQIFRVNGNTNQIEIVSQVPAGTSLSQGQTMSQVANAYGVSLPGKASTSSTATGTGTPAPAQTPPVQTSTKTSIPDAIYSQLGQMVAAGNITKDQAMSSIQGLISGGQYTDSQVNTSKLFPQNKDFTGLNGSTVRFDNSGTGGTITTNRPVQTSVAGQSVTGVTKQLDPGTTDPQVLALQKFLNANGFPVASTGPGSPGSETSYFGPATQAALEKYQASKGIVSSGDPTSTGYGRVGPQTLASIGSGGSSTTGGTSGNSGNTGGNTDNGLGGLTPTGDASLDSILKGLVGNLSNITKGYQIPDTLKITPDLIAKFLDFAHQVVDPQTRQLIQSRITDINANLKNQATQYGLGVGSAVQEFGTNLANEQESAGGSGTAFSGQRGINERNMVAGTNRTLASLGSSTAYNMGAAARAGAADVGASNAGGFVLPSIAGGSVSNTGGSRGSFNTGDSFGLDYNPSLYTAGNIPTSQNTALNNLQGNYLTQYTTLAGNNSNGSRSIRDLLGMISGLPAGANLN